MLYNHIMQGTYAYYCIDAINHLIRFSHLQYEFLSIHHMYYIMYIHIRTREKGRIVDLYRILNVDWKDERTHTHTHTKQSEVYSRCDRKVHSSSLFGAMRSRRELLLLFLLLMLMLMLMLLLLLLLLLW